MDLKAELERLQHQPDWITLPPKVVTVLLLLPFIKEARIPKTLVDDRDYIMVGEGRLGFWYSQRRGCWFATRLSIRALLSAGREHGLWT
jgi:hypothetical protein